MSHTPHDLAAEFPEKAAQIQDLKATNAHFAKLCDAHHSVNREIHRGESDIEPMDDAHLEALKKQRLTLLDEIVTFLN